MYFLVMGIAIMQQKDGAELLWQQSTQSQGMKHEGTGHRERILPWHGRRRSSMTKYNTPLAPGTGNIQNM